MGASSSTSASSTGRVAVLVLAGNVGEAVEVDVGPRDGIERELGGASKVPPLAEHLEWLLHRDPLGGPTGPSPLALLCRHVEKGGFRNPAVEVERPTAIAGIHVRARETAGRLEVDGPPAITAVAGEEPVGEDVAGAGREERRVRPLPREKLV
jgi:hypothetical protein